MEAVDIAPILAQSHHPYPAMFPVLERRVRAHRIRLSARRGCGTGRNSRDNSADDRPPEEPPFRMVGPRERACSTLLNWPGLGFRDFERFRV